MTKKSGRHILILAGLVTLAAVLAAQAPLAPGVSLPPYPARANPLDKITPVTDAKLAAPPAEDWLSWRRTLDDVGFSPLKQITKGNVANLRVAWSWSLPNGPNETAPLVHDGVLFVQGFGDRVQAINAATGDLLWQYSRDLGKDYAPSVKRAISLYGDKVFLPTSDVHMVALDIKTGKVVWDREIGDFKAGFRMNGGTLAAKGKVMVGTTGRAQGGNYIIALDANTGQEAWRFYAIARPGEPGGDSWNGLTLEQRNGASVWTAGSYDPVLNLAFFGPGQTYDTAPVRIPVNKPGITNEGLYTDTTIALNPDTGKLVWHFQHQPNDQWDLDWAFERQLIRLPIDGQMKTAVVTAGKQAIYDVLDAATGKYVFSMDLGLQNSVTAIDPKTGAKTVDARTVPGDGEIKTVCPHVGGAKNWLPSSYNPDRKILYVPMVESCMDMIPVKGNEKASLSTGVRMVVRPRPDSDGKYGRLEALNLETRKVAWTQRQRAPISTGALATAGGVVFVGSVDRVIRAFDDANGKVLWEGRLNDAPNAPPISFGANGKQYLAVVAAGGAPQTVGFLNLVPEVQNPPDRSATLWVFELP